MATTTTTPESTLLDATRLFARLEHNLLAPSASATLAALRKDEFQRMRVAA
ncbi:hypothetical protein PHISP_02769, partial [Aspergillus sp. HF37]